MELENKKQETKYNVVSMFFSIKILPLTPIMNFSFSSKLFNVLMITNLKFFSQSPFLLFHHG
jgi:hypothetical protein